jgi:hypothetical protein
MQLAATLPDPLPIIRRIIHPLKARVRHRLGSLIYRIGGLPTAIRVLRRRGNSPLTIIRRAYAHRYWRPRNAAEAAELIAALLLWPVALAAMITIYLARHGPLVAKRSGRSLWRQFLDQVWLYAVAGVLPPWYYIYELHERPLKRCARGFLFRCESKGGLFDLLTEGEAPPRSNVSDKLVFAQHCAAQGIATIPILAVAREGVIDRKGDEGGFDCDLFVKRVRGKGGREVEGWNYIGNGRYRDELGRELDREALLERHAARSFGRPLLIQPRLRNHPAMAGLTNGALATVRAVSCLNERNEAELIGAVLRMAVGSNHLVDNGHAGGIAASIDLATGRLEAATDLAADGRVGWLQCHPNSGAPITGFELPHWRDLPGFVARAHGAFCDRILVGWDIAICPEGLVLVEANAAPGLDLLQRPVRRGLARGRLGEILAYHLEQRGLGLRAPAA